MNGLGNAFTVSLVVVLLASPSARAVGVEPDNALQGLMSEAEPGAVVEVPAGVHRSPLTIDKALTLKGKSPEECVVELTADESAVLVSSKAPVVIDSLTIKWQLVTREQREEPACAVTVKDSTVTLRNCRVIALGNFKRCPAAALVLGFSKVKLENCRFEGFEFTLLYGGGAEGSVTDCVFLNPGHCGATVHSGSKVEFARNIITGSSYHGLRCTGGTILAHDNLIINNKNRGIYLGNKNASGKVSNNVIVGNATGISAFAQTDVTIENNLMLDSSFAGLDSRDSCPITVRNNIFQNNAKGIVLFAKGGRNQVKLEKNSFWKNETDTEDIDRPEDSILVDPRFTAPDQGDFTPQADELKTNEQGLSDPIVFRELWQKWEGISKED